MLSSGFLRGRIRPEFRKEVAMAKYNKLSMPIKDVKDKEFLARTG